MGDGWFLQRNLYQNYRTENCFENNEDLGFLHLAMELGGSLLDQFLGRRLHDKNSLDIRDFPPPQTFRILKGVSQDKR